MSTRQNADAINKTERSLGGSPTYLRAAGEPRLLQGGPRHGHVEGVRRLHRRDGRRRLLQHDPLQPEVPARQHGGEAGADDALHGAARARGARDGVQPVAGVRRRRRLLRPDRRARRRHLQAGVDGEAARDTQRAGELPGRYSNGGSQSASHCVVSGFFFFKLVLFLFFLLYVRFHFDVMHVIFMQTHFFTVSLLECYYNVQLCCIKMLWYLVK